MKLLTAKHSLKIFALIGLISLVWGATALAVSTNPTGVPVESDLGVANVTAGDTTYKDQVNAKVDDVVKFEIWYHNPGPENTGPIAENVNVKISIPAVKTKNHVITSTVGGSNTNTESDVVAVTTAIDTSLEYIPGTAYRRFNNGSAWQTVQIPDIVTTTGYVIPQLKPCWDFQETITVQARVKAPVFTVDKYVKLEGDKEWLREVNVKPGDKLAYMIAFKNVSNVTLTKVLVRDSFPPQLDYVEGSATLTNGSNPNGINASDNLINGGTYIGDYAPGAAAYIRFNAMVPKTLSEDGCYTFNNVVNIDTEETDWVNNNAIAKACYKSQLPPPPEKPEKPVTPAPENLPVTGPAEAAVGFGSFTLAGSVVGWLKSKKRLLQVLKK